MKDSNPKPSGFGAQKSNMAGHPAPHPQPVEDDGKALSGQVAPVAQGVHHRMVRPCAQLPAVKESGGQGQQGFMGAVVIHQLGNLRQEEKCCTSIQGHFRGPCTS